MNARILSVLFLSGIVAACATTDSRFSAGGVSAERLARQVLVTTHQDSGASFNVLGDPGTFYLRRRGYGPTPGVNRTMDQIARDYDLRRVDGWYIASLGEYCEVFELRPEHEMADIVARISADPRVELAQPMNVFETEGIVYDDPYAPMQPALATLAIEAAHEIATGKGVTIAVVDSSVDKRHRELRGRVTSEIDLVSQRNHAGGEVHGTAVAGIIGSAANNGEGIVGVAPDAHLASLRACWTVDETTGSARCSSFSLALAIETAMQLEADVINLSLAGPPDALLGELIDAAVARGSIVVAAMPDSPGPDNSFPSSHAGVMAVESAESPSDYPAANLLRAPGAEIMSTAPNNAYAFFSGNSMSAAYISGVSALVREHRPAIRSEELIRLLMETGHEHLVNACRAIARVDGHEDCESTAD